MTDTASDARAIIDTARLSTTPHKVEAGGLYVVPTAAGYVTVDLTGDKYRALPRRKQGTTTVEDVASFAQYYGKHAASEHGAEVFADLDHATITAVLNAHGADEADWQDHRLTLRMRPTEQWKTWTGQHGKMMSQQAFAEFIENNSADVAADGPVTAADLLEVAQSFHAHTKVQFSSGKRLDNGQTEFKYVEDTTAAAGTKGNITIPTEFQLGIRPFEDCAGYRVLARFRYRLDNGVLALGYQLDDPARIFREAVGEMTEKTEDACDITIMRGQPA